MALQVTELKTDCFKNLLPTGNVVINGCYWHESNIKSCTLTIRNGAFNGFSSSFGLTVSTHPSHTSTSFNYGNSFVIESGAFNSTTSSSFTLNLKVGGSGGSGTLSFPLGSSLSTSGSLSVDITSSSVTVNANSQSFMQFGTIGTTQSIKLGGFNTLPANFFSGFPVKLLTLSLPSVTTSDNFGFDWSAFNGISITAVSEITLILPLVNALKKDFIPKTSPWTLLNLFTLTSPAVSNYPLNCGSFTAYSEILSGLVTINHCAIINTTNAPTKPPTSAPTNKPTLNPTLAPTANPTLKPTSDPTNSPTKRPTDAPTAAPSYSPSRSPSSSPTSAPTMKPSFTPTSTPTAAPSYSPSRSPSPNPTRAPTGKPTTAPTTNPTQRPTQSPTRSPTPPTPPTISPTRNPTQKPTTGFFGSQSLSLPFGSIKAFDLYLLIDTTRNYELINNYCQQYRLMSGAFASSCFDLMMDYATEIVKGIATSIGYYSNDFSRGLRVQASLITCVGTQRTPASELLFNLTGDSTTIMKGFNYARTNAVFKIPATCPLQGLYDTIQKIENEWSSANNRPYKAIITLTDAQMNDASGNAGNASINVISGIRFRCTPILAIIPFRMTDSSPNALNQQLSLKILTANITTSVFEVKVRPQVTIPKIGEQITSLLSSSNSRCSSSTSFSTADKYWCGYNRPALCFARNSCEFISTASGCQKIPAQSGCNFGDQTSCTSNTHCRWISSSCYRKAEDPDCNALVLQTSCNMRSDLCTWNGSACIFSNVG